MMKIRAEVMAVAMRIEEALQRQEDFHKRHGYHSTKLERVSINISGINPKGMYWPKRDEKNHIKDFNDKEWYPTKQTTSIWKI